MVWQPCCLFRFFWVLFLQLFAVLQFLMTRHQQTSLLHLISLRPLRGVDVTASVGGPQVFSPDFHRPSIAFSRTPNNYFQLFVHPTIGLLAIWTSVAWTLELRIVSFQCDLRCSVSSLREFPFSGHSKRCLVPCTKLIFVTCWTSWTWLRRTMIGYWFHLPIPRNVVPQNQYQLHLFDMLLVWTNPWKKVVNPHQHLWDLAQWPHLLIYLYVSLDLNCQLTGHPDASQVDKKYQQDMWFLLHVESKPLSSHTPLRPYLQI